MTENKRFTVTQDFEEHHRQIRDNGHIIMGCFVEPQAEVIVNLLNELSEENEQLKKEYLKLDHRHGLLHDECLDVECERDSLKKDVESLEKENEQLKKQNKMLRTNVGKLTDDVKYLRNLPSTHQKENKQLKTFLEALKEELSLADRDNTILEKENKELKAENRKLRLENGKLTHDLFWANKKIEELQE